MKLISLPVLLVLISSASAQSPDEESNQEESINTESVETVESSEQTGGQDLSQAANDPTASLTSVQLEYKAVTEFHNLDDEESGVIQFRSAIPFTTGELNHIGRITVPLVTDNPSGGEGIGDVSIFDLVVFDEDWGRWGVGIDSLLPTATDDALASEKWAVGPAAGFIAQEGKLLWGAFNQNVFTVAGNDDKEDINASIVQPIINYSLPDGWAVGTSEMNFTYNWEKGEWATIPLGAKLTKLYKAGDTPIQTFLTAEHNFADSNVAPEWTFSVGFKVLF